MTPDVGTLVVGATLQLTAIVRDAAGNSLTGRSVLWAGDMPSVASVSGTGLVTAISAGGPIHITATSESRIATATINVSLPSSATVGPEGGTVATPIGGATVNISRGAVSGQLYIQVRDSQESAPHYAPLSANGLELIVPITGTTFAAGGSVNVALPTELPLQVGQTAVVRARFRGVPGEFWAEGVSQANGKVLLSIPSAGFADFKTILRLDTLDVVLNAEQHASPGASLRSASSGRTTMFSNISTSAGDCPALPPGANPPDFISCSGGKLSLIRSGAADAQIAIVLVHGWSWDVGDGRDYYANQGITCPLIAFLPCFVSQVQRAFASLPSVIYFSDLIQDLQGASDATVRNAPVYLFDYQSYNDVTTSAIQLKQALSGEVLFSRYSGFVVVAHSMGGLVSRVAAQLLETESGRAQTIRGIITLGTPHLGTELVNTSIAGTFTAGLRTPGGQSLALQFPRNERAPLYMYGGNINNDPRLQRLTYFYNYSSTRLCAVPLSLCDNDGVVPVASSLPEDFLNGKGVVVRRPPLIGYDHTQLKFGNGSSGDPQGLFGMVAADLSGLLKRAGATGLNFSVQPQSASAGSTLPALKVTVVDGIGQPIGAPSLPVTLALASNPAGGVLSGGSVASSDPSGSATFSTLSIDRPGTYTLTATMPGLQVTSSSFTITPAAPGTIVATPTTGSFSATAGAALPASQAISITSGGGGALTGLSVGTVTYTGTPGWLATPTLSGSTTPSTLTLRPNTTSLAAGTHTATVQLTASGANSTSVALTYTVSGSPTLAAPTLLDPADGASGVSTTPTFDWSAVVGADRYWLIVSTSSAALPTDLSATSCPGCSVSGTTGLTSHTLPTVFPNGTGGTHPTLAAGTQYFWKVQGFNSDGTLGQYSAERSFTTATAVTPAMVLDRTTVPFAFTLSGAAPSGQIVNITNGGTGSLSGLAVSAVTYAPGQPTGWLSLPVIGSTAPTTLSFAVLPAGLPVGSFSATVQVSAATPGATGTPQTVTVTITVSAAVSAPTIALNTSTETFQSTVAGANPPSQGNITITNSGTGTLSGLSVGAISYQAGQPSGWLGASLSTATAPSTLTLTATTGALAAGTYNATVPISSTASGVTNSPRSVNVTFSVAGAGQFVQQGPKLVGAGAVGSAEQGFSVALAADGNTAIVGGRSDNGNTGAVWFWTRSGSVWTQQGAKKVVSGATLQGHSVSISADGNTAIVGGRVNSGGGSTAMIWTRNGGNWTQQGSLLVGSGAIGNLLKPAAVSLSADGNTAIVGGPGDNSNAGAAWVWVRSGGVWTQQGGKLVGSGATGGFVQQGWSVSLSADGNTAVVGGNADNSSLGAAWVWVRSGGVWTQEGGKLVGSGATGSNVQQGSSVSLSADGNTIIIGGFADNIDAGAAWVWTRSGGSWTQQGGKLVGSGSGSASRGWSVALSADGNKAIVGGWSDSSSFGAAWVWTRSGAAWTQQGSKLIGSGAVGSGYQGWSVALSSDGTTAIIGGISDNSHAGAVWIFN